MNPLSSLLTGENQAKVIKKTFVGDLICFSEKLVGGAVRLFYNDNYKCNLSHRTPVTSCLVVPLSVISFFVASLSLVALT